MKLKLFSFLGFALLTAFVLTSCGPAVIITPTPDIQAFVQTSVAQTLAAIQPQATPTLNQAFPTPTLMASLTPFPTFTPFPTYRPVVPTSGPCYHMNWVKDVTIPDNTEMAQGTVFVKTWRLWNDGSCAWTTSFQLVYFNDNQMGGPAFVNIPATPAGAFVDVSVTLTAPSTNGTYKSGWKLKAADGTVFGSGNSGVPITAVIVVKSVPFAVTSVAITVDNASWTGDCTTAHIVTFNASITANAPGTVQLHWVLSDGTTGFNDSLTFTGAGSKNSSATWSVSSDTSGSASVYIDSPNHQSFGPGGSFTVDCTP